MCWVYLYIKRKEYIIFTELQPTLDPKTRQRTK